VLDKGDTSIASLLSKEGQEGELLRQSPLPFLPCLRYPVNSTLSTKYMVLSCI
jgi:hypothetical protein